MNASSPIYSGLGSVWFSRESLLTLQRRGATNHQLLDELPSWYYNDGRFACLKCATSSPLVNLPLQAMASVSSPAGVKALGQKHEGGKPGKRQAAHEAASLLTRNQAHTITWPRPTTIPLPSDRNQDTSTGRGWPKPPALVSQSISPRVSCVTRATDRTHPTCQRPVPQECGRSLAVPRSALLSRTANTHP